MEHFRKTPAQAEAIAKALADIPGPSDDPSLALGLLGRCPVAAQTPLVPAPELAFMAGIAQLHLKDERARMGLGSFKALGAAYVIARDAQDGRSRGQVYVTASAGNHGLSVAAGAAAFGARAVIYLAETVPGSFAARLRALGAEVMRAGSVYEQSMEAAAQAAQDRGWVLLSDSSWDGYLEPARQVMEGYLVLMQEAAGQIPAPPSHIFLQAGVGGLAAACAAYARKIWGAAPLIIVVEPQAAPALLRSVQAGQAVVTQGPASQMGRLDCKEPSLIALKGLGRDADIFMTLSEAEALEGTQICVDAGFASTPSGAAGVAGLLVAAREKAAFGLDETSRVLAIFSEEAAP